MYAAYSRHTDAAVKRRMHAIAQEQRRLRLEAQRAIYEAKLIEAEALRAIAANTESDIQANLDTMKVAGVPYRPTYRDIERRACKVFRVTRAELTNDRRGDYIVLARQFVCYWCARLTGLSYPQIGRLMRRDHTTILASKRAYPIKRAKMSRNLREVR